ncbi:ABC transporter ATP-binding protein [Mycoplasma sp. CSL7491-lung]|uniref:ABC transporter ATP-binding protein n=1 Tax=Mycoplasma sp. CSL7491-lung TaxID=549718 RepID=UPI001C10B6E3|nr:ABC transporter ATP-binding protein [Mycoplasma sp. CSL7491-lung]MBU4693155.1 ABC transporter ATP-binding protein [Mycoplasma sp. CSL7491-lung]
MNSNEENKTNSEVIVINNLEKSFKKYKALKGISFSVNKGELFGFLGLNGAGKTTTLNIILGLLKRDAGEVLINGQNIDEDIVSIRKQIGIVFQESILDPGLNVYQNLLVRASLYKSFFKDKTPKEIVDEIIDEFQLNDFANRNYSQLSGGQKRRVDIARALVHKPSILFLDEPTTGLDPNSRKLVWEILGKIQKDRNLTILLTTHYMEEANNCNRAIIIQKGEKLVEGSPSELKSKYSSSNIKIYKMSNTLSDSISKSNLNFKIENNVYTVKFKDFNEGSKWIKEHIKHIEDYEFFKGSMDEVFLNVTEQFGGKNV